MENLTPVRPASIIGNTRLKELKTIKGVAKNLVTQKTKNFDLEKKFFKVEKDSITRSRILERERQQELKKPKSGADSIKNEIKSQSVKLYDLFKFFAGYKVLQWMSKPENIKSLGEIAKAMKNIFKVIDYLAGIGVEGVLGGLHSVLFGGSFLERFFGVFKAIGGFFIIRRLLFPGKILKDIAWILKNRKNISKVFKAIGSGKFKDAIGRIFKLLNPNLYTAYTKGLTAGIKRVVLKVFGKNVLKLLTKVASKIGFASAKQFVKNTIKTAAKPLSRIPLVGPILGFGLNLIFGDPLDKAAVKLIGSSIGAWLGGIVMGALGSIIPVAGTAAGAGFGAVVGGLVGDWVGDKLYGFFKGFTAPKEPALAVGGIVTKPTRALIGEAGPEAVIPLPRIYDGTILNAPMGIVASSMIGGIDAVITSLGPIGLTIRPYASSLLSPYRREFGSSNYVFTSNIGSTTGGFDIGQTKTSSNSELEKVLGTNKTLNIIAKKESSEESKKARYNSGNSIREILADILNNIINLDFKSTDTIAINTQTSPNIEGPTSTLVPEGGLSGLTDSDWNELAYIVSGEAGPGDDRYGVAAVVLNRVASPAWPNTIREVGRQSGQFEAVEIGTARYDKKMADDLKNNQGKIAAALKKLNGRDSFKGRSQYSNMGSDDIKFNDRGNFYHYRQQTKKSSPVPSSIDTSWKKWIKAQAGGLITTQGVADTGPGYTIKNGLDEQGRPVVFSEQAASAFYKMMKDSGGIVKPSDVASSKRSIEKNTSIGGARNSKHLYGVAMDIHGSSNQWIRKNGSKYGWIANDYPGSHGGHFEFSGQGIQPSNAPQTSKETSTTDSASTQPTFNPALVASSLTKLYQMLNAPAKFNGAQMEKDSMEHLQALKDFTPSPDTYIMMGGTNVVSSTNLITPVEFPDYSAGSYSSIDSSLAFNLKTRL
jgi:hypothetical protein